jgi:hypothetical protein
MPGERETTYRQWLNDNDSIFIWFVTERGVVKRFVVQYETIVEGKRRGVLRYDTAHGFARRDILDPAGRTVRWEPTRDVDYATALTEAIDDLEANWERYREEFLRRRR